MRIVVTRGYMVKPYQPYSITLEEEFPGEFLFNNKKYLAAVEALNALCDQAFATYTQRLKEKESMTADQLAGFTKQQVENLKKQKGEK